MKNLLKIVAILVTIPIVSFAQQASKKQFLDSTLLKKMTLDFSIPDMPAFKALGTNPSNILRPTDLKDFAAMIEPFYSNGNVTIPKSFAVEVAPWKIVSKKWQLNDYYNSHLKKALYNSSFSVGTNRVNDKGTASKLSIGFRTSILSKKDDWVNFAVDSISNDLINIENEVVNELEKDSTWLKKNGFSFPLDRRILAIDSKKQVEYAEEKDKRLAGKVKKVINDEIYSDFQRERENGWATQRFDFAMSWVGKSPDSLVKNAAFSSFHLWGTYAMKLGKKHRSQLLLGGTATLNRTENPRNESNILKDNIFTGNIRLYNGSPTLRGFVECQYKYETNKKNKIGLINLGAELSIQQRFWISISGGFENLFGKNPVSQFVSSIDLRYGLIN